MGAGADEYEDFEEPARAPRVPPAEHTHTQSVPAVRLQESGGQPKQKQKAQPKAEQEDVKLTGKVLTFSYQSGRLNPPFGFENPKTLVTDNVCEFGVPGVCRVRRQELSPKQQRVVDEIVGYVARDQLSFIVTVDEADFPAILDCVCVDYPEIYWTRVLKASEVQPLNSDAANRTQQFQIELDKFSHLQRNKKEAQLQAQLCQIHELSRIEVAPVVAMEQIIGMKLGQSGDQVDQAIIGRQPSIIGLERTLQMYLQKLGLPAFTLNESVLFTFNRGQTWVLSKPHQLHVKAIIQPPMRDYQGNKTESESFLKPLRPRQIAQYLHIKERYQQNKRHVIVFHGSANEFKSQEKEINQTLLNYGAETMYDVRLDEDEKNDYCEAWIFMGDVGNIAVKYNLIKI